MKILAIETSCDETSAAVVADGKEVLSNIIASQVEFHKKYGGIVPEIASRKHIEVINPISYPENPYPEEWFNSRWTLLTNIPWEHIHVLELPDQISNPDLHVVEPEIFER